MRKIFFGFMLAFIFNLQPLVGYCQPALEPAEKGTQVQDQDGLYQITVIDDGYSISKGVKDVTELVPTGTDVYQNGNYLVQVFAVDRIPADARGDLRKSFDWINQSVMMKRAKKKVQILSDQKRDFKGIKALYVGSIFPGKTSKGAMNLTVIQSYGFAYVNLVFYDKDRLFWIYYSRPETEAEFIPKPRITGEMKEKFDKFLDGITLS